MASDSPAMPGGLIDEPEEESSETPALPGPGDTTFPPLSQSSATPGRNYEDPIASYSVHFEIFDHNSAKLSEEMVLRSPKETLRLRVAPDGPIEVIAQDGSPAVAIHESPGQRNLDSVWPGIKEDLRSSRTSTCTDSEPVDDGEWDFFEKASSSAEGGSSIGGARDSEETQTSLAEENPSASKASDESHDNAQTPGYVVRGWAFGSSANEATSDRATDGTEHPFATWLLAESTSSIGDLNPFTQISLSTPRKETSTSAPLTVRSPVPDSSSPTSPQHSDDVSNSCDGSDNDSPDVKKSPMLTPPKLDVDETSVPSYPHNSGRSPNLTLSNLVHEAAAPMPYDPRDNENSTRLRPISDVSGSEERSLSLDSISSTTSRLTSPSPPPSPEHTDCASTGSEDHDSPDYEETTDDRLRATLEPPNLTKAISDPHDSQSSMLSLPDPFLVMGSEESIEGAGIVLDPKIQPAARRKTSHFPSPDHSDGVSSGLENSVHSDIVCDKEDSRLPPMPSVVDAVSDALAGDTEESENGMFLLSLSGEVEPNKGFQHEDPNEYDLEYLDEPSGSTGPSLLGVEIITLDSGDFGSLDQWGVVIYDESSSPAQDETAIDGIMGIAQSSLGCQGCAPEIGFGEKNVAPSKDPPSSADAFGERASVAQPLRAGYADPEGDAHDDIGQDEAPSQVSADPFESQSASHQEAGCTILEHEMHADIGEEEAQASPSVNEPENVWSPALPELHFHSLKDEILSSPEFLRQELGEPSHAPDASFMSSSLEIPPVCLELSSRQFRRLSASHFERKSVLWTPHDTKYPEDPRQASAKGKGRARTVSEGCRVEQEVQTDTDSLKVKCKHLEQEVARERAKVAHLRRTQAATRARESRRQESSINFDLWGCYTRLPDSEDDIMYSTRTWLGLVL